MSSSIRKLTWFCRFGKVAGGGVVEGCWGGGRESLVGRREVVRGGLLLDMEDGGIGELEYSLLLL